MSHNQVGNKSCFCENGRDVPQHMLDADGYRTKKQVYVILACTQDIPLLSLETIEARARSL
jgi:hypothetical protein